MKKLGILIAITAAATLGFSGSASADGHEEMICGPITGNPIAENFDKDPTGGNSEPVASVVEGIHESCVESNSSGPSLGGLVCGPVNGLSAASDGATNQITDPVLSGLAPVTGALGINCTSAPPKSDPAPSAAPSGGGGSVSPTVQAANAAPDGGLPRTGGELFAGAGFALMSLGALVRRFLP